MPYKFLSNSLHVTADRAVEHFRKHHGAKQFKFEEVLDDEINYRPTIQAMMRDYHFLCVEVTDSRYPGGTLQEFIHECMQRSLPVRLYLAVPDGLADGTFRQNLEFAKKWTIGFLVVAATNCNELLVPTSLSLAGVREINRTKYPAKYRQALSDARSAFLGGNPAKGCALLYDEIESVSRKIGDKTHQRGLWKAGLNPTVNLQKGPWARVLDDLLDKLDHKSCRAVCPQLTRELLARTRGITSHRNESGHKPSSKKQLIQRDTQLRTRFEHAADLLLDLISSSKGLSI